MRSLLPPAVSTPLATAHPAEARTMKMKAALGAIVVAAAAAQTYTNATVRLVGGVYSVTIGPADPTGVAWGYYRVRCQCRRAVCGLIAT